MGKLKAALAVIAACAIMGNVSAQEIGAAGMQTAKGHWFAKGGLSGYLAGAEKDLIGLNVEGGYYLGKQNFVSLGIGGFFANDRNGTFTYTALVVIDPEKDPIRDERVGSVIRQMYVMPVLLSWNYIFGMGDRIHICVGPSLGGIFYSASRRYKPLEGMGAEDVPANSSSGAFTYALGVGAAFQMDLSERSFLNIGYRLLASGEVNIREAEYRRLGHQAGVTFGWVF